MRIVSLIPSATEIVHALGLGDLLVGISHDCDFPASVRSLPVVTKSFIPAGTSSGDIDRAVRELRGSAQPLYELDMDLLEDLAPDLILTQALCTVCAVSEEEVHVAARRLPRPPEIVNLEASTLAEVWEGIRLVASKAGAERAGVDLVRRLSDRVERVVARSATTQRKTSMVFLEWLDPPFACGHWNPELIRMAGASDPFGREGAPAQTVPWSGVEAARPEMLFVACCGFGVERALEDLSALTGMGGWRDVPAVRDGRVYVADGSAHFSRPGPRLADSLEILAHAVDPRLHPPPEGAPAAVRVDVGRRLGLAGGASAW